MKKSLIALLVATLPAAAFADVTIYGAIKAGVESNDNGVTKQTNIDDLGSRIGFKGSEDLGNGLKAIWQVETGFAVDGNPSQYGTSSNGTFANRNSFLGLQGNFGTVRMGNVSNFLDSDMGTVDAWTYNNSTLGLGIFTRDATRLKNSVRYDIPAVVPGLTAAIQYGAKETKDAVAGNTDREVYGLGFGYENSGFFGKYNFQREGTAVELNKQVSRNDKHRLEVGYNANNLFVGFGYQQEKGSADIVGSTWAGLINVNTAAVAADPTKDVKTEEYAFTAAYTLGAFTPKFTYAHGKDIEVNGVSLDNTKYDQYVVGVDYALSKRTTVGAQYGQISLKGEAENQKSFGLNMVHNF